MGRGEVSRFRGPGQALEQVTVWPVGAGMGSHSLPWEMEILADSTLACVMDFFLKNLWLLNMFVAFRV